MNWPQLIASGLISGIVGALLAAFVTPKVQHHYWTRQKLRELQFAAFTDANSLMSTHLVRASATSDYKADAESLAKWLELTGRIRVLFHEAAWEKFQSVDRYMGMDMYRKTFDAHQYVENRNETLRAFLSEMGIKTR